MYMINGAHKIKQDASYLWLTAQIFLNFFPITVSDNAVS